MLELFGALIAVLGAAAIAAIGWTSKRATREGRLVLKIERLGAVYSVLPESAEKKQLERHLLRVAGALNEWLDEDVRVVRRVQWIATGVAAIVGAIFSWLVAPSFANLASSWLVSFGIGAVLGAVVVVVVLIAQQIRSRKSRGRERERIHLRYAAIERGEFPTD